MSVNELRLAIFDFEDYVIRTATGDNGEPLVCASDLARACGMKTPDASYRRIYEEYKVPFLTQTLGGEQQMVYFTEPGVYQFLGGLRPKKDSPMASRVERLQKWIYGEVLPSIRKTGSYSISPEPEYDPDDEHELILWQLLQRRRDFRRVQKEQERQLALLKETTDIAHEADKKAETAVALAESVEASYTGRTGFKAALGYSKMHGYKISRNHLSVIGRALSKYCREHGHTTGEVQDERYDTVRTYPLDVLDKNRHLFERYSIG